jgi:enamine deaminase RidA (YjgF/YER057c/UK114 family)
MSRKQPATPVLAERGRQFSIAALRGTDPSTGELPTSAGVQFHNAFRNLERLLKERDLTPDEVGRVTVLTPDRSFRPLINDPWLALFPNGNRPARRTTHVSLADGVLVELLVAGVRGATRTPLEIEGVRHKDPLPMGALLDEYLFSSAIVPDAPSGEQPDGIDAVHQAFANLRSLVAAAGATVQAVSHVSVYLGRWDIHDDMVDTWVSTFPDDRSRPSRKTYYYPSVSIQLHCDGVLGGSRANFEIDGLHHRDPIPMGAVTAGTFTTSGIDGRDPANGRVPRHVGPQAHQALENLRTLIATAGTTPAELLHVDALVGQQRYAGEVLDVWRAAFPDPSAAPTLQVTELGLVARDYLVQFVGKGVRSAARGPKQ